MTRYALIVGISDYQSSHLKNLSKTATDAKAVAKVLETYGDYNCTLLTGKVLASELKRALQTLMKRAYRQEALIYYTGHGIPVEDLGGIEGFLAPSDCAIDRDGKTIIEQRNGISLYQLDRLLSGTELSSLMTILDCCHSELAIAEQLKSLTVFDRQQNRVLLAACREFEKARAKYSAKHSVFTGALLAGLQPQQAKEGRITNHDLSGFIDRKLKGTPQEPISQGHGTITLVYHPGCGFPSPEARSPGPGLKRISQKLILAHAKSEEDLARCLVMPLQETGYTVAYQGTAIAGEVLAEEAMDLLGKGCPVVLCGTIRAMGTTWAKQVLNLARKHYGTRFFCLRIHEDADVEGFSFDETISGYWQDRENALQALITVLKEYFPLEVSEDYIPGQGNAEQRYRELALEACDIVDLANLPECDRHIAVRKLELRQLYVPLRVQVEFASSFPMDGDRWELLENRHKAHKLGLAGWMAAELGSPAIASRNPVGERLQKAQRLVVLGDPGAGKTTLIRWIATAYLLKLRKDPDWKNLPDVRTLPDRPWLPIILRCRELGEAIEGSLDDILGQTFRKAEMSEMECSALRELFRKRLQQGKALLLVDGLDEITDGGLRVKFCRQLEKICTAYPQAAIVATSRIVGYREMGYRLPGFEHTTVTDLSREDKDEFARRWCNLTENPERKEKAREELIEDIHCSDRIERLTGNPMLLTTMALVKRKVGKLPSRRGDLYWEAVQVLLNWRREVDEPIDHREAVPQLEYLAYAMCDRGVQQLREDEVLDLLRQMRAEYPQIHQIKTHTPEEFLRLLERRTGMLIEVGEVRHQGRPVPVFEFRHLTFQEYMAGLALVDGRFPDRDRNLSLAECVAPLAGCLSEVEKRRLSGKPELAVVENWREALRLCIVSCNDDEVDEVLRAVLHPLAGEDAEITARPRAVFAVLCLADEPNVKEETAREVLDVFVEHINENDGNIPLDTTVDIAAISLVSSPWENILCSLLLQKFQTQVSESRMCFGRIFGAVKAAYSQVKENPRKWYKDQVMAIGESDNISLEAVLSIYGITLNMRFKKII